MIPFSFASLPIAAMSWIVPISLFANMTEMRIVLSVIAFFTSSTSTRPFGCTGTYVTANPCRSSRLQVSSPARCSIAVVTMWLPFSRYISATPLSARLIASVPPDVNTTSLASRAPMRRATLARAASVAPSLVEPAQNADGPPQRPNPFAYRDIAGVAREHVAALGAVLAHDQPPLRQALQDLGEELRRNTELLGDSLGAHRPDIVMDGDIMNRHQAIVGALGEAEHLVDPRLTATVSIGDLFSRTLHQPGGLSSEMAEITDTSEFESPLYRTALAQLDRVAARLSLEPNIHERLRHPRRALVVSIPVRMDDGNTKVFRGYRVQHSTVLGPTKGGLRYDADVNLGEVTARAMLMSWKCALAGLPYGGAKGGVRCNPRSMSVTERENLTRRYTVEIMLVIGPDHDIPAPDLGTDEQTMAWMMDTYSMTQGKTVPGIVTGKPLIVGGSAGRREATGRGIVYALYQAARHLGQPLRVQRV